MCVDHCILLLKHLSNRVHFITNGYKRFSRTNSTDPRQRVPLIQINFLLLWRSGCCLPCCNLGVIPGLWAINSCMTSITGTHHWQLESTKIGLSFSRLDNSALAILPPPLISFDPSCEAANNWDNVEMDDDGSGYGRINGREPYTQAPGVHALSH